jgi:hypothetical protein
MRWYDDRQGLLDQLKLGIPGLHLIANERHAAYTRGEKLAEWIVLGRFQLDRSGNFDIITEGAPADHPDPTLVVPDVITQKEAGRYTSRWTYTHKVCIPPLNSACSRCLHGWTFENIADFIQEQPHLPMHESCYRLKRIETEQRFMQGVLKKVEGTLDVFGLRTVPNEYCQCVRCPPWFIFDTAHGPVRIGRRKHVYEIAWSQSDLNVDGRQWFTADKVSCGARYVHASRGLIVEYLARLGAAARTQNNGSPLSPALRK